MEKAVFCCLGLVVGSVAVQLITYDKIRCELKALHRDVTTIGCNYKFERYGIATAPWYAYDADRNVWSPSTNCVRVLSVEEVR